VSAAKLCLTKKGSIQKTRKLYQQFKNFMTIFASACNQYGGWQQLKKPIKNQPFKKKTFYG